MPEIVRVPDQISLHDGIGEQLLSRLVGEGKLPADVQFRLLGILDHDERRRVGIQEVLAALGYDEPSGSAVMSEPLPVAVYLPFEKPQIILQSVDADYYLRGHLLGVAANTEQKLALARRAWTSYVRFLAPDIYEYTTNRIEDAVQTSKERVTSSAHNRWFTRQQSFMMSKVALRADQLRRIHDEPEAIMGHGPVQQETLRLMLLDSYPDLRP